jgi:hypothetical protein
MGIDDEPLISSATSLNEEDPRPRNKRGYLLPTLCDCCPFDALPALILFCIMFLTFGSYWVFDFPGAVQTQLNAWFGPTYSNADVKIILFLIILIARFTRFFFLNKKKNF